MKNKGMILISHIVPGTSINISMQLHCQSFLRGPDLYILYFFGAFNCYYEIHPNIGCIPALI